MALIEWSVLIYWEHEVWKCEKSIVYRIKELKQKMVSKTITVEEKEELQLLIA